MKKYYVVGRCQLELREEPDPEPGPNQVLIESRVSAVSVGTEVWRYINGGHYGGEGSDCGYNTAGVVVRVGADVRDVQVGDAVFTPQPHAQLVVAEAHRVVKLPTGVDFEAGAFTYLPTLGLHALRSAGYAVGENVLVIGQGIVGLLAAQVAQMVGARVAALEIDPGRRALASDASIATVLDPSSTERETLFDGVGPDVVVETSQAWPGLETAMRLARADTRVAVVGIYRTEPPEDVARKVLRGTFMDRDRFHNQRLRIIGCSNDLGDDYPADIVRWTISRNMQYIAAQIADHRLDPTRAITHRVGWKDLESVYQHVANGGRDMLGVSLDWS
jgi:threonine dehydrogenase-like Zn-dependent dehydrogenase